MDINLFIDLELNRNKIIEDNYGLVINEVMKKFIHFPFDREDLIQYGLIGLMKAVDTYKIDRNYKFSTYAIICIDNEIYMFLRKEKKHINVISYYENKTINIGDIEKDIILDDCLFDTINLEEEYVNKELYYRINQIIDSLSDFDQTLLKLRFGFNGEEPKKVIDIANQYGVSYTSISRRIIKLLDYIGRHLQDEDYITDKIRINKRKTK